LRRTAELVRMFNDQGLIVIGAFVSPTAELRAKARAIVGGERFFEVFCDAPLEVCEQRDTEHLFERAHTGEIANVTGVGQAYEPPTAPELRLDTANASIEQGLARLIDALHARGWLELH
jgi:adenylylsulfate kinase